jgi:hypothetical protein
MSKPRKIQREQAPPPTEPRQMSIVFESNGLRGLSTAERTKVLMDLAHLLMFELADAALHTEQQAIVGTTRIIHTLHVDHSRLNQTTQL